MEELKELLEKWFLDWMWCNENGVERTKWEYGSSEVNLYLEVDRNRKVVGGDVVVSMRYGIWDKIKVREIIELDNMLYRGNGGSFKIGGVDRNDKWVEWRFKIVKDEENGEDGFVLDGDGGCCWFVINGRMYERKGV